MWSPSTRSSGRAWWSATCWVAGAGPWPTCAGRRAGSTRRAAEEDAGAEPGELLEGDWSPERGYAAGAELVARGLPDGVFCSNDLMALGALAALRDRGIRVPADVVVAGYDDVAGAAFFSPPLTTVRQPFDELGRLCMEVLLEAIGGDEGAAHSIPPTLQVRRSSE